MRESTHIDEIGKAIVAALGALQDVAKTSTANVGTYSYTYAGLPEVMEHVRTPLYTCGLAVMQSVEQTDRGPAVTTRLMHTSGQWIESDACVVPVSKGGPQEVGSAITYARRYSLLAFLGLATEDDDGGKAQAAHDAPHPLSDRVAIAMADMKAMTDTKQAEMKAWADGRKLSGSAMLADERWLEYVEAWIAENGATDVG